MSHETPVPPPPDTLLIPGTWAPEHRTERALAEHHPAPGAGPGGLRPGCLRPPPARGCGDARIMHEVAWVEAEQAGAEMYLASFPPAGHTGPSLPRCARKSSRRSDQSRSRRGERETVPGRSLGKINTLQDWCQAAHRPLLLEAGSQEE